MNILHSLLEGNSPHKKGTPAYKKHMAAMHAESEEGTADMNEMKEVQTSVGIMVANDDGTPVSEKDYYRWTMKTDKNPPKANIISQRYQIYLQDFKQYAMGESMNEISDFKRRELEYELRHEEPNRDPKKRRPYRTPQEKIQDAKKRYSKAVGVMKGNTDEATKEKEKMLTLKDIDNGGKKDVKLTFKRKPDGTPIDKKQPQKEATDDSIQAGDEIMIETGMGEGIVVPVIHVVGENVLIAWDETADSLFEETEEVDEGEKHGNSKIYNKCWKGYRKVPGKSAGEKGSCVKENIDDQYELFIDGKPATAKLYDRKEINAVQRQWQMRYPKAKIELKKVNKYAMEQIQELKQLAGLPIVEAEKPTTSSTHSNTKDIKKYDPAHGHTHPEGGNPQVCSCITSSGPSTDCAKCQGTGEIITPKRNDPKVESTLDELKQLAGIMEGTDDDMRAVYDVFKSHVEDKQNHMALYGYIKQLIDMGAIELRAGETTRIKAGNLFKQFWTWKDNNTPHQTEGTIEQTFGSDNIDKHDKKSVEFYKDNEEDENNKNDVDENFDIEKDFNKIFKNRKSTVNFSSEDDDLADEESGKNHDPKTGKRIKQHPFDPELDEGDVIDFPADRTNDFSVKQADALLRSMGFPQGQGLNILMNKPFDSKMYELLIDTYMNRLKGTEKGELLKKLISSYEQRGIKAKELPPRSPSPEPVQATPGTVTPIKRDPQQGELDFDEDLDEAEYQGRKVKLGKPTRGDTKKFKVYVKDPKTGNVKKVNFGHGGTSAKKAGQKTMSIKKSNPARRKSFRARHNCDNPGPRTKARYWSCRAW
tara:strand:- start:11453 stop:13900 length:2448 start_codon:yes stop_codon:yes gene_type:complete